MSEAVRRAVAKLADGEHPSLSELRQAFEGVLSGQAEPALIAALLMGLRTRGETAEDIIAGAQVLRAHVRAVAAPAGVIDTCGTGGLAWTSLNTSTAAALVAAGAGAVVAKHGNRSVPPKSGSADVLEALGVNLSPTDDQIATSFKTAGVAFLFAPAHHAAMKHVAPVRKALGIRTIFNLLGPLANPAGATRQVLGVFAADWVEPYAQALTALGSKRAWVVHGRGGLDEISTAGASLIAELKDGAVRLFELTPEEMGVSRVGLEALRGGEAQANAAALSGVLRGEEGAFRDLVVVNAAAALVVADLAETIQAGIALARASIDSGRAHAALEALRSASHA